jgi:hypothetical protein
MHQSANETATFVHRLRNKAVLLRSRIGGAERNLLGYVVRAVDDVAARCDELAQQVNDLAISLDDLARTVGADVTRIRAEMESSSRPDPQNQQSSLP